jgi:hypothetical protein
MKLKDYPNVAVEDIYLDGAETKNIEVSYSNKSKIPDWKEDGIKLLTANELQSKDIKPINWIVPGFLPEGLAIIAGKPKLGKSWACLNLSLSITQNKKAFDYFDVEKHEVLYLSYEDNFRRLQSRIKAIIGNNVAPKGLYFSDNVDLPKINDGGIEYLETITRDYPNIKLVIIDTLGKAIQQKRSVNNNVFLDDYELTANLQTFAIQKGICVLFVHHTRKAISENVFDSISGSVGLTASQDTMMVLKEEMNGKINLHITGRDVLSNSFEIEFMKENCSWVIKGKADKVQVSEDRNQISELFGNDVDKILSLGEISLELGKTKPNVNKMLRKMISNGILEKANYGKYKLSEVNYNDD